MIVNERSCTLEGCLLLDVARFEDSRGGLTKIFQKTIFEKYSIPFEVQELFYTQSKRNVLRGMHFQEPPFDHNKMISCLVGDVLDVVVDLREASPTYGVCESFELSANIPQVLFIPRGFAHGYYCTKDSLVMYNTSTEFNSEADAGIHYESFGFQWPCSNPILSEKDMNLPTLSSYKTCFTEDIL